MGLDHLELIIEIEERFHVSFDDVQFENIVTAGDLCQVVENLVQWTPTDGTLLIQTFCRVRQTLVNGEVASRSQIRPSTDLATLIPSYCRGKFWKALAERLEFELPLLQEAETVPVILLCAGILISLFAAVSLPSRFVLSAWIVWVVTTYTIGFWLWSEGRFGRFRVPTSVRTVGALTRRVATNFARLQSNCEFRGKAAGGHSSPPTSTAWPVIREIVAEILFVDREQVTREARLVADLGMD